SSELAICLFIHKPSQPSDPFRQHCPRQGLRIWIAGASRSDQLFPRFWPSIVAPHNPTQKNIVTVHAALRCRCCNSPCNVDANSSLACTDRNRRQKIHSGRILKVFAGMNQRGADRQSSAVHPGRSELRASHYRIRNRSTHPSEEFVRTVKTGQGAPQSTL